jgi:hypothetical protein
MTKPVDAFTVRVIAPHLGSGATTMASTSRAACTCVRPPTVLSRRSASRRAASSESAPPARAAKVDPVSVYQPYLKGDAGWKAPLSHTALHWWQRSTLTLAADQKAAAIEAKRQAKARHTGMLRLHRDRKLHALVETYHASHAFPSGSRADVLAAIDAEFLDRTPDRAPLPLSLDTLLTEAAAAAKDDDARGEIAPGKVADRAGLFDALDARRVAGDAVARDTVGGYIAHVGDGLHGRRAMTRAARVYDALHGTAGLGQAGLETVRDARRGGEGEGEGEAVKPDTTNQRAGNRGKRRALDPPAESI